MKDKKQKQQAMAKVEASAHTSTFDLTRITPEHYAAPLAQLFHSVEWHNTMVRRNKLLRGYLLPGDKAALKKQHLAVDRKLSDMLLDALVAYHDKVERAQNSRDITLAEYVGDFVKTPEQRALYKDFSLRLNSAVAMFDMGEAQLVDALEVLKKLDPSALLYEYEGIRASLKAISNLSLMKHKGEHPDITALYTDYVSDLEIIVHKHTYDFIEKFNDLHKKLVEQGKVSKKSNKEVIPLY